MDIDKLEAGRELDALIAERVMGCHSAIQEYVGRPEAFCGCDDNAHEQSDSHVYGILARYSTDIAAAWEVLEKLVNDGYCPGLIYDDNDHWALSLEGTQNVPIGPDPQDIATSFFVSVEMWCDTPQLAICHAALQVTLGGSDG